MHTKNRLHITLAIIALITASIACGPLTADQAQIDEAVQGTLAVLDTAGEDGGAVVEGGGEAPAAPAAQATEEPPTEPPTPTATVDHQVIPTNPGSVQSFMTDRSTAALAGERRAIADNFDINLLERPFSAESMDYKDYLDITRAELSLNPPFVYVTIYLEGGAPTDNTAAYGVEVDTDIDGHGDWLILGVVPADSTWTTTGVRACRDANGDVGGPTPMRTDLPHASRDGYEDCVFDSGYGVGPDEAWIRRDPSHADRVQIAFLFSLIGSDGQFMWGAWADEDIQEPEWFDYHDHFTLVEAGSPASESSNYPLKAMALMDNTCRWGYGFNPTGTEIGVCYVPPTPTPILPGSISGTVWWDVNYNGDWNSGEGGWNGATVRLHSGGCGGSVIASMTTGGSGGYSFNDLTPGNYCVSVVISCGSCSGTCASTADQRSVSVGSGQNVTGINFGLYLQGPC